LQGVISYPWAAEGLRHSAPGGFRMGRPLDKILCEGKFYRYVVACMHNCPNPHFCREFWHFFDAVGKTPAEYYNEDGIGERAMRRVVFDCDRCGKRDIEEMFGLYNTGGEADEFRITPEERVRNVEKLGYSTPDVPAVSYAILAELEKVRGWQHYCGKCFQAVVDSAGKILNLVPKIDGGAPRKKPAARKASTAEGGAGEEGEATSETGTEKAPVAVRPEAPAAAAPAQPHAIPADIPVPRSKGRGMQVRPQDAVKGTEPAGSVGGASPGHKGGGKGAPVEPPRASRTAGNPAPAAAAPGAEEAPPVPERRKPGRPRKVPPTPTTLPLKS